MTVVAVVIYPLRFRTGRRVRYIYAEMQRTPIGKEILVKMPAVMVKKIFIG
jgi:hypothetical protein